MPRSKEPKFEEALSRLEEIVTQLEDSSLSLDHSLQIFEEGVRLARFCGRKLEEAESKIEMLITNPDGTLAVQPFPSENGVENEEG
jgi:exodeoxyribonuclease VII small subunit